MPTILEVDLRPMDRPEPKRTGGYGELHRARHGVVIGEGNGAVTELEGRRDKLVRQGGAVKE